MKKPNPHLGHRIVGTPRLALYAGGGVGRGDPSLDMSRNGYHTSKLMLSLYAENV